MFGLSFGEILIIMVVALLVLGPDRLPKVAKTIGKGMREFRRTTGGFREVLEGELFLDDEPSQRTPPVRVEGASTSSTSSAASVDQGSPTPVPRAPTPLAAAILEPSPAEPSPEEGELAPGTAGDEKEPS